MTLPGLTSSISWRRRPSRRSGVAHSLNVTDIHTTWVETRAVLVRREGRQATRRRSARSWRSASGVDADNGSEFINDDLYRYSQAREIEFTRGRPYKKDDNADIEQKNGRTRGSSWGTAGTTRPRRGRLERALSGRAVALHNLFLLSVKLVSLHRVGARCAAVGCARTPRERPGLHRCSDPQARLSCSGASLIESIPSILPGHRSVKTRSTVQPALGGGSRQARRASGVPPRSANDVL